MYTRVHTPHTPTAWNHISARLANLSFSYSFVPFSHLAPAFCSYFLFFVTGELGEFKKGPFHLARAVGAPLVPLIIRNAHSLWPPGQLFTESGDVV